MLVTPHPDAWPGVRELLDKYGLRPRKRLGQHFLADPNILSKIVAAAELSPQTAVLEIGPGLGTLTRWLAAAAGRVVAVELDEGMIALLRQELAGLPNLELVHGDILQLDPAALVRKPGSPHLPISQSTPACTAQPGRANLPISQSPLPYTVVANLPYYITSAAIRHLLEAQPPPVRLVLTVQQEVARRIVAGPGDMSLLAVSVQFYGRPQMVARIPAGAFIPPPQVDSAVLRIDTYPAPPVHAPDREAFFRVVRAGFGQKRKQLKNALTAGLGLPPPEIAAGLARAGVDPQRRAETLSLAEWAALTREFSTL